MPGKEVKILVNAAGQRVFNWNDREMRLAVNHRFEYVIESEAGESLDCGPKYLVGSVVAERAMFALKRNGGAAWEFTLHD